ncbi:chemotaxis protein CheC [uncultured Clostridium sp.]|uniref:chemotaxis protein CheC n=1 Tax=uncultured Clostridium sp. TaxID=59620 RepID=UPI0026231A53|nr:chemotaxis protein CheC [uncultured Clostridium sp.]
MNFFDLTELQLDALKEISNIGAGNAATALSSLLNKSIDMEVPLVRILDIEEVYKNLNLEEIVIAALIESKGEIQGQILFLFKEDTALDIIKQLTGIESRDIDEMGESVICEIGNIISGTYMNAISSFTGLKMITGVPAISYDIAGAVIPSMFLEVLEDADKILEIKAILKSNKEKNLAADFYYLPSEESLEKIFKSIGLI